MNSTTIRFSDHRRTLALLAVLAIGAIGASGSAFASTPAADALPTMHVTYSDLNLSSPQGSSELYARIVAAARQVCHTSDVDIRDLGRYGVARACEAHAIAAAVQAVRSPALAAIYASRQPHG